MCTAGDAIISWAREMISWARETISCVARRDTTCRARVHGPCTMSFLSGLPPEVFDQIAAHLTAADLDRVHDAVPDVTISRDTMLKAQTRDVITALNAAIQDALASLRFMVQLTSDYSQTTLTHCRAVEIQHFKLGRTKWVIDVRHHEGVARLATVSVYDDRSVAASVRNPSPKLMVCFDDVREVGGALDRARVRVDADSVGAHLVAWLFQRAMNTCTLESM